MGADPGWGGGYPCDDESVCALEIGPGLGAMTRELSDLFSKVSELLSDPDSAQKIKSIAASLSGGGSESSEEFSDSRALVSSDEGASGGDLLPSFGFTSSHSREVNLLNALRPYLRSSRAEKVDRALKAIRVIDLLSRIR